jgi:hypothetical protein
VRRKRFYPRFTLMARSREFFAHSTRVPGTRGAARQLVSYASGWEVAMNPVECLLKSENYVAAAQLDPLGPDAQVWLELAAAWRMRAIEERHGIASPGHAFLERSGEIETWNALGSAGQGRLAARRGVQSSPPCANRASNSGVRGNG